MDVEQILARLDKVRQKKARPGSSGAWVALCPAHADKSPSLSISESEDGKILLKCWVGCSVEQIVSAIGLQVRDLFPGDQSQPRGPSKAALKHEQMVYLIGMSIQANGSQLSADDQARFELAKQRLGVGS